MTGQQPKLKWAQLHPKVLGGLTGSLIAGLITAELTRRAGLHLLPEEQDAIVVLGGLAGGWLKKA